jgi:hypothetical protein
MHHLSPSATFSFSLAVCWSVPVLQSDPTSPPSTTSARNPSQDNIHLPRRVPLIYATTPRLHFPLHHPLYYHRSSPHPQARGHRHLSLPGSSRCSGAIFHSAQCTSKLSFPHFSAAWRSTRASSFVLPLSSSNQFEPQFPLERHVVEVLDRKQRVASSFSNTYWPTPALGLPHGTRACKPPSAPIRWGV